MTIKTNISALTNTNFEETLRVLPTKEKDSRELAIKVINKLAKKGNIILRSVLTGDAVEITYINLVRK